jgi:soluble lytic murein transglycosylase-like protein
MQSRKTFIGQSAPIGALIACLIIGEPVRADVYAYVKSDASVVLTNIAVAAMQPAWTIRGPDALEVVAKPAMPTARDRYQDEVQAAAREYAVDSDLIHAVIVTESNYVRTAISPKGALGLMQLMPPTSKTYGVANAFDAMQNIRGGAQLLRHLLATFNGDIELALAAYNAGEMAVLKHGRAIPPFPETINYVRKVQSTYRDRKQIARVPAAD